MLLTLSLRSAGVTSELPLSSGCGLGKFKGISMKRLDRKSSATGGGIGGDLTAMTCGRIGPNEMTDPASDIRYHSTGGRGNGEYELLDRSSFPSITLTLKSRLIVATYLRIVHDLWLQSNKDYPTTIFAIPFALLHSTDSSNNCAHNWISDLEGEIWIWCCMMQFIVTIDEECYTYNVCYWII